NSLGDAARSQVIISVAMIRAPFENSYFKEVISMRRFICFIVAVAVSVPLTPVYAYNAETHRDMTAYAYELMASAKLERIRSGFATDPLMVQFLDDLSRAVNRLDGLPANLPEPHRDNCIDLTVLNRFGTLRPLPASANERAIGIYPVPLDIKYIAD